MLLALSLWANLLPARAAPPTERAFASDMIRRFQVIFPTSKIASKVGAPLTLVVTGAGKAQNQINLNRIFGYCQATTDADCIAAKAEFVAKLAVAPPTVLAASLRLIVRDGEYMANIRSVDAAASKPNQGLGISEQIGDDLFAILAADGPNTIELVGDAKLAELKLTRDEAWALAVRQTKAVLPPLPTAVDLKTKVIAFEDREYLASLLIDRAAWAKLSTEVGSDMFVTAVSDQFVFVGTMPSGGQLDALKKRVVEDCRRQQRCVSPNVYRFRGGRWAVAN